MPVDTRIPTVCVKRANGDEWIIDCPYCHQEHLHGPEEGHRVAHCPRDTVGRERGYDILRQKRYLKW